LLTKDEIQRMQHRPIPTVTSIPSA
jgi:hypothetical protein